MIKGGTIEGSAKTEVGAITDASSGNETVGAFTDTRFDQIPFMVQSQQLLSCFISNRRTGEDGGDFRNAVHQVQVLIQIRTMTTA